MQQLTFIHGEICRVHGGQYQTVLTAPEHVEEEKEKEEWEGDWDKEKAKNDWYASATVDPAVDLVWCQNANERSLGGRMSRHAKKWKATSWRLYFPAEEGGGRTTWKVTDKWDEEWKEGECGQQGKSKNSQGKDPSTFKENSQGGDPSTLEINSQGGDPRTFEGNSQGGDPSTFKGRGHQAKRWRDQERRKEEKWKKKKKKKKKKKVKYRRRRRWKKCKKRICKPLYGEDERG